MRMHTPTRPDMHTYALATHTQQMCHTYCLSTATMIRERASVLSYTYIACHVQYVV